jgi:alkanesulfonate monooxygenase SsuD/methylene tetrahydromethanopterin reductase-like flavin-dependent oxidoreductase (luciferase family)
MKTKIFAVIGLVSVALAVYFFTADESTMTKEHEVEDIKELVNDYSVGNIKNQSASITSHQLIVTDSDEEAAYLATSLQQRFLRMIRGKRGRLDPPVDSMDGLWTPQRRSPRYGLESRRGAA